MRVPSPAASTTADNDMATFYQRAPLRTGRPFSRDPVGGHRARWRVVQSAERRPLEPYVGGSSPPPPARLDSTRLPARSVRQLDSLARSLGPVASSGARSVRVARSARSLGLVARRSAA